MKTKFEEMCILYVKCTNHTTKFIIDYVIAIYEFETPYLLSSPFKVNKKRIIKVLIVMIIWLN